MVFELLFNGIKVEEIEYDNELGTKRKRIELTLNEGKNELRWKAKIETHFPYSVEPYYRTTEAEFNALAYLGKIGSSYQEFGLNGIDLPAIHRPRGWNYDVDRTVIITYAP